ncbi:MAG: hypothetical protein WCG26_12205, partial [Chloroflexales bacterium]
ASGWVHAAWQFGGEARANGSARSNPNREDRENIAYYHPAGDWDAMPADDRDMARLAFFRGSASEKRNQR